MPTRASVLLCWPHSAPPVVAAPPAPPTIRRHAPSPAGLARRRIPVLRRERQRHGRLERDRPPPERRRRDRRAERHDGDRRPLLDRERPERRPDRQARPDTLPAYFTATTVNVTVPASGDVPVRRGCRSARATGRTSTWLSATASRRARARAATDKRLPAGAAAHLLGPRRHRERGRARHPQQRRSLAPARQPAPSTAPRTRSSSTAPTTGTSPSAATPSPATRSTRCAR